MTKPPPKSVKERQKKFIAENKKLNRIGRKKYLTIKEHEIIDAVIIEIRKE